MVLMKKVVPFLIFFLLFFISVFYFVNNRIDDVEGNRVVVNRVEYLYPSLNSKDYYEEIYENIGAKDHYNSNIGIVNHHLFAPNYIAEVLESISTKEEKTVVLVSPNHFDAGVNDITASDAYWDTAYGVMESDKNLINDLGIPINNNCFKEEHGIKNVITFVKHAFPNSKVVPIIVKEKTDIKNLDSVVDQISQRDNIIVIGSFDFAHEKNVLEARIKDKTSLAILKNLDVDNYNSITVDSQKGLYLVMRHALNNGAGKFELFRNTSAAELIDDYQTTENTSYITGIYY